MLELALHLSYGGLGGIQICSLGIPVITCLGQFLLEVPQLFLRLLNFTVSAGQGLCKGSFVGIGLLFR